MNKLITRLLKLIPRKNKARSHARAAVNHLRYPMGGKRNYSEALCHITSTIKALKN